MNDAERTPSEAPSEPIGLILEHWVARLAGVVQDGRALRSRLGNAGSVELGAIALEAAGAAEHTSAACLEAARLLRAYVKRGSADTQRDLPAIGRRRRWSWATAAKVIAALAALLGALAAWRSAH